MIDFNLDIANTAFSLSLNKLFTLLSINKICSFNDLVSKILLIKLEILIGLCSSDISIIYCIPLKINIALIG